MSFRIANIFIVACFSALQSGCSNFEPRKANLEPSGLGLLGDSPIAALHRTQNADQFRLDENVSKVSLRGATDFGGGVTSTANNARGKIEPQSKGGYSLNFVDTELQEFVRAVFDEVLKEPIVIPANLQGRITVRTQAPVSKSAAIELIKEALASSGVSLFRSGETWRISDSRQGGQAAGTGRTRDTIRVIPVVNLDASEAKQALQNIMPAGSDVSISSNQKFLIVAGGAAEVDSLEQLAQSIDVDQYRGQGFSLIPLKQGSASSVAKEINGMFGGTEGTGVRAMPIERMNAVVITSKNRNLLNRARNWVSNLDQRGTADKRVIVYPVRNRRAADLAKVLNGMLRPSGSSREAQSSIVAPGLTPQRSSGLGAGASESMSNSPSVIPTRPPNDGNADNPEAGIASGSSGVEIRADVATNSLVIISKGEDSKLVEAAIRRLDVMPTQVLIEATIAEVRLNDSLRGGVRWFFQKGNNSFSLTDSPTGAISAVYPGFNYSFGVPNAKIVLNALESVTDVEIISSPALTVLDNHPAVLKVGDQVPITTRTARSVTNPEAPLVNEVQMKDTGVILSVTPRVSSSGLVVMDIIQEASDVVPTTSSSIDSPTIRQRQISSVVTVESGSEVILGGIISKRSEKGKSGVPFLKDIPILGAAFTSNANAENGRTELLIILRPTIMTSRQDIRAITQEITSRMAMSQAIIRRSNRKPDIVSRSY